MRALLIAVVLVALAGCATLGITYSGGDGSSFEQAVVIKTSLGTENGIGAERAWIHKHYPGAQMSMQSLRSHEGKPYDVISIVMPDGSSRDVYFDITDFFGK
jgi:hypothetical protein